MSHFVAIFKQEETTRRKQEEALPGELVEVPQEYKGLVIGKGRDTLRNISTQTGANVILKGGEVYIASGTEEQREQARVHIKIIIVSRSLILVDSFISDIIMNKLPNSIFELNEIENIVSLETGVLKLK